MTEAIIVIAIIVLIVAVLLAVRAGRERKLEGRRTEAQELRETAQTHDQRAELESAEALMDAEVRVELRGAVALDGYADQRELRWATDLDEGVNQLTLPVIALDATGGQVLVEVTHRDKRRAFVIDVRGRAG